MGRLEIGDVFVAPSLAEKACCVWTTDGGHPKPDKSSIRVGSHGTMVEFWYSIKHKNGSETYYVKAVDTRAKNVTGKDEWLVVELRAASYNGGFTDKCLVIARRIKNGSPSDVTLKFHQHPGFSDSLSDVRIVRRMKQVFVNAEPAPPTEK